MILGVQEYPVVVVFRKTNYCRAVGIGCALLTQCFRYSSCQLQLHMQPALARQAIVLLYRCVMLSGAGQ